MIPISLKPHIVCKSRPRDNDALFWPLSALHVYSVQDLHAGILPIHFFKNTYIHACIHTYIKREYASLDSFTGNPRKMFVVFGMKLAATVGG